MKPWRFAVLDEIREKHGLTQKEVAAAAGHDVGWYQAVMKYARLRPDALKKAVRRLKI